MFFGGTSPKATPEGSHPRRPSTMAASLSLASFRIRHRAPVRGVRFFDGAHPGTLSRVDRC